MKIRNKTIMLLIVLGAALFMMALAFISPACAKMPSTTYKAHTITKEWVQHYRGVIVDNTCAAENMAKIDDFMKTCTKSGVFEEEHRSGGYSLFVEGVLMKFNSESNRRIEKFLEAQENDIKVVIKARKYGNLLDVVVINNKS